MFGLENIGKGSVEEAHRTVNDLVQRIDPLLHAVMNRAGGILHGVLDRLNGTTIIVTVKIPDLPKAEKVE
jgi:hypothetical protein